MKKMRMRMMTSLERPEMMNDLVHDTTCVAFSISYMRTLSQNIASTQYSWFHVIFAIAAMYVAMLLTDWNVVKTASKQSEEDVYIGRSEVAMWMRVVSSWVCMLIYMWTLLAPVFMPDRYGLHLIHRL